MIDYKPVEEKGVLSGAIAFYPCEVELYRNGGPAFLILLAQTAQHRLREAGGLAPYTYSCIPGASKFATHTFVAKEREF